MGSLQELTAAAGLITQQIPCSTRAYMALIDVKHENPGGRDTLRSFGFDYLSTDSELRIKRFYKFSVKMGPCSPRTPGFPSTFRKGSGTKGRLLPLSSISLNVYSLIGYILTLGHIPMFASPGIS